jgi:hypothetical protein
MVQTKQLKDGDQLTPIADFANAWGVTERTIQNWVEMTYQSFEIILPNAGPYPPYAIELLTLCAKHVSGKANMYYAETGERRRLRGTEYVAKMRRLRAEGHFQNFEKFRKGSVNQELAPAAELEDDLLAEVGQIVREGDEQLEQIYTAIDSKENQAAEGLATFIEESPTRMIHKTMQRLRAGRAIREVREDQAPNLTPVIDVTYKRLPGA